MMALDFLLNLFSSSYSHSHGMKEKGVLSQPTSRKILVVDDDDDFRFLLCERLERMGLACFEAENGDVAKSHLKNHQMDLVITDHHMPITDGLELIDWLQETQMQVPIILVSGDVSRPTREKAEEAGVCAVVEKPCSLANLLLKVEKTLKEL